MVLVLPRLKNRWVNIVTSILDFQSYVNYAIGGAQVSSYGTPDNNFIDIAETMDTDADIVMVMGGINDAFSDVPIGDPTDIDPSLTFYGALNDLMTSLKTTYAGKRIIFMSPYNTSGEDPIDYVNAMRENRSSHSRITKFIYLCVESCVLKIDAIDSTHLMTRNQEWQI